MKQFVTVRSFIFLLTGIIIASIFFIIGSQSMAPQLQIIRLTQAFGFLSLFYLYISLLISPLFVVFPSFPMREHIINFRRAIGVSAFFFALLHSSIAFFGQLGGLKGIFFLSNIYLIDLSLSATALIILTILALTSFDIVIDRMTFPKWKLLHRLVYVAGLLILIHTFMLGTHFQDLASITAEIGVVLLALLGILDAIRLDRYLLRHVIKKPMIGPSLGVVVLVLVFYTLDSIFNFTSYSLGIHSKHLLIMKQAQDNSQSPPLLKNLKTTQ